MDKLIISGGAPLRGEIRISGAKNAVLPILCATLLTSEPVRLVGIPEITDVRKILEIFRTLGSDVQVDFATGVLDLHHRDTRFDPARHHLPEEMRSSIMLVPPLLARFGVARIENDVKGCTLGVREIDPHVEVMERFGRNGERFDVVVVDPPSFAQRQLNVPRALTAYGRLTTQAVRLLRPGGVLVQCSCSSRVTAEQFHTTVARAAAQAGRPLDEIRRTGHDVDHPVTFPEGSYLKAVFARVP